MTEVIHSLKLGTEREHKDDYPDPWKYPARHSSIAVFTTVTNSRQKARHGRVKRQKHTEGYRSNLSCDRRVFLLVVS